MAELLADDQQLTTAVAERGQVVWIVFGVYSDRSGSKIFSAYTDQWAAEDRVKLAKEPGSIFSMNYAKVPLNKAFSVELNP